MKTRTKTPAPLKQALAARRAARGQRIRYVMRKCALELDGDGQFIALAREFGWHPVTISKWIEKGYVPKRKAEALVNRFGAALTFTLEDLTDALK